MSLKSSHRAQADAVGAANICTRSWLNAVATLKLEDGASAVGTAFDAGTEDNVAGPIDVLAARNDFDHFRILLYSLMQAAVIDSPPWFVL